MKAIKLTVKNIGMIADASIDLNQPLILFYGEIRQGKTTLLNAVKWVFGGAFPTDIIRRGEPEAMIRLDLDCGSIIRTFYVAKDGTTKARALIFEKGGTVVKDAVAEVKKLLNPFLLDQNYLASMSELERKKYFASMFAIDTAGLDSQIIAVEWKAVETRVKLKAYGEIDLTPVAKPADIWSLQDTRATIINMHRERQIAASGELAERRAEYAAAVAQIDGANRIIRDHNAQVTASTRDVQAARARILALEAELAAARLALSQTDGWLSENPPKRESPLPTMPDTAALEAQLSAAADTAEVDALLGKAQADEVRFNQYVKNEARQKEREADEALILGLDATVRELRSKKLAKLKACGESSGIPGLAFDEAGNFSYEECQAGMLSTSQLMRLSSQLSGLYPEGFGVELIDRAESLGRSIFDFVDQAKAENKTILASIVGEKPAMVPADVGVFVVEGGNVKSTSLL